MSSTFCPLELHCRTRRCKQCLALPFCWKFESNLRWKEQLLSDASQLFAKFPSQFCRILPVAVHASQQVPPICYEIELVLFLLLVESFLKHLCLDMHRGNRWKLPRKTETRCSTNKPVENFVQCLPSLALHRVSTELIHTMMCIPWSYKRNCVVTLNHTGLGYWQSCLQWNDYTNLLLLWQIAYISLWRWHYWQNQSYRM